MSVQERKRRERRARRDGILDAAARVFARLGLEGATIELIAREAEVAVGTIYLYFCSRDDLFISLQIERIGHLRERYVEIKARALAPLDELRAIAGAYVEHLRESRGLFLTQLSAAHTQLYRRLRSKAEIENFKRLIELSADVFRLWEASIKRVYGDGSGVRTAVAVWAALNGAFLLTGDDTLFREVTGLSPAHLVEDVLDFELAAAETAINTRGAEVSDRTNGRNGVARRARVKHKDEAEVGSGPTVA